MKNIARKTTAISLGGALILMLMSSCVNEEISLGERIDSAWVPYGVLLWPFTTIEACFDPYSPSGDPTWNETNTTYIQRTQDVRNALESAIDSVENTALQLFGWNTCPPNGLLDGWRITVQDSWNGASADLGYDPNKATGVALGIGASMGILIHEFGHALGFDHEHLREDVDPICTDGPGDGTMTGYFLTEYDHASIMNGAYCSGQDYNLTASDKLAIAFLYPARELPMEVSYRIAFNGGYAIRESPGLVTTSGWVRSGILPQAVDIQSCSHSLVLVPSDYEVGFSCTFRDYWNRLRVTETVAVVKSNSKHASVLMAIL